MRRDTTASLKSSFRKRNRNTTVSATPFDTTNNISMMSRNSNRLNSNSICVPKSNFNTWHKSRIMSH